MQVESIHNIFRAYDIRGIVGTEITDELSLNIGCAFGSYILNKDKSVVGVSADVRPSSKSLLENLIDGLLSTGIRVINFNELPTPISYYSLHNEKINVDAAIQITGSHNPSNYNGFKLTFDSKPFFGEDIQLLYKMILNEDYLESKGELDTYDIISDYNRMIEHKININKRLKVAIDCGNAAGCLVAPSLFKKFNIDLYELYCDIDGTFPNHHPDPTVDSNLVDLQKFVLENGCDLGIAFDGDADRIVAIDEKGGIIRSDILMTIFLSSIVEPGDSIVYDVKCSKALEDMIKRYNGNPVMWKTGHSLIKNKMKEEKAKLGGEMSGHIFFADDYFGYDDAIYVGLRLVELLSDHDKKLSEIVSKTPKYYSTPELRLDCIDDNQKVQIMSDVFNHFSSIYEYSDIDGIRLELPDGWALIRCSNTQPVIVCRVEAMSEESLQEYKNLVIDKLLSLGVKINEDF
tara:strand:- start:1083 stop:2462 length:1380 start_codon:yes stop_codon:yes gene_type:complete